MNYPEYSGFEFRQHMPEDLETEVIEVEIRRLDDLLSDAPHISYMKVDTEGAELLVFKGAQALIKKWRPVITFEMGDIGLVGYPHTAGDMYDFFSDLGYRVCSIFGVELTREQIVTASARQLFWDYIAYHPEGSWRPDHAALNLFLSGLRQI